MSGAIIPTSIETALYSSIAVLIPDEWGNYSDRVLGRIAESEEVLIPDEWGNYSDVNWDSCLVKALS